MSSCGPVLETRPFRFQGLILHYEVSAEDSQEVFLSQFNSVLIGSPFP